MGLIKPNTMVAFQRVAFTIALALLSFVCQTELVQAQRLPRFRGLAERPKTELKREYDEAHEKYFSKIDDADSHYQQSFEADAKSQTNQAWQKFLTLPKTIRKLQVTLDRNANWSNTVSLLTRGNQVPQQMELSNDYVCQKLMSDLSELPRATGDAPHACKFGSIKIYYDDPDDATRLREFEIGISDTSFIMGNGSPGLANTSFYSWSLARVLYDAVKEKDNHLTQLSFNILSGFNGIASPVKFNARVASAKLRDYWAQPADVWYTIPTQLRLRNHYLKPRYEEQNDWATKMMIYVDVKTHSDPSEEFHWFNEDFFKDYSFRPLWASDEYNQSLLKSRFTFRGPTDIQQCKIMGVISLQRAIFADIDIFVTDKGFLAYFNSQYQLFHSYDLAAWLETIAKERRCCISQKAFNVLSGIDSIVSKQQSYLGIDAKPYNNGPAQTRFVAPEELTSNRTRRVK